MIQIHPNIMSDDDCFQFISFFNENMDKMKRVDNDNVYHFEGVNLIDNLNDFVFFKRIGLNHNHVDRIRVQHVDKDTNILEKFHTDKQPYAFVVFLNDDFNGGEFICENVIIKPKKKTLIYTSGNEPHYVKAVPEGKRFTLVCFMKQYHDFNKVKNVL